MSLKILAGQAALEEIRSQGLSPKRIKLMVGASGGPKWFMLSRLDQYLSEYFMPEATQSVSLIGSSVGSWRMACYAQDDPLGTFKEFEALYLDQRYTRPIKPSEITGFVDRVLDQLFTGERARQVVQNPIRKLHVVAVRNRRWLNGRSPLAQGFPLLLAAAGNVISPRIVNALYPRVVVSQEGSHEPYMRRPETITLTEENLAQSLVASGAIPIIMEPTKIHGGRDRLHWDGGIADYHFSGPFNAGDGLVLYPHFSPKIIPGWFDKGLPWRRAKAANLANVVMLAPSAEFIEKLPYSKIPDRKDFEIMTDDEREAYWQTVLDATMRLVDELHESLERDGGKSKVEPISTIL